MSRREDLRWLAPVAPPCFADRLIWIEFLMSASDEQKSDKGNKVLILEPGQPVRFNHAFNWCAGCLPEFKSEMQRQGRCKPNWLRERAPKETSDAAA